LNTVQTAGIISKWLTEHYLEISGTVLGLVYIYLSVRQKIWTWPFGIATSVVYAFVFYASRFYAGMGLQIYYVAMSVYGWYFWLRGKRAVESKELPVSKISTGQTGWSIILFLISFISIYFFLSLRTDSPVPLMDALTTSLSIVATWLLAGKILENWLIWIIANLLSIGLYMFQNLWPTVLLFGTYEVLAIVGYFQWKRSMQNQPDEK
jgi:nicotinamide mononucleotide transporter